MAATKKEKEFEVELAVLIPERQAFIVKGISPLQTHRFGETALTDLRDSIIGKAKKVGKKKVRDPEQEYKESMYLYGSGTVAVPATMFKAAMVNAVRLVHGLTMAQVKQMIFTFGTDSEFPEFCAVTGVEPEMHEVIVPTGGTSRGSTLSYRAIFPVGWEIMVGIEFLPGSISLEQVANLLNLAGFSVGIGCQRPERGGQYGRFGILSK